MAREKLQICNEFFVMFGWFASQIPVLAMTRDSTLGASASIYSGRCD